MDQQRVELNTDELFHMAMQTSTVEAAVANRAAKIAVRTRRELGRAKVEATVSIDDHYLLTGRASKNVTVTVSDEAHRRKAGRILRRAGREIRR